MLKILAVNSDNEKVVDEVVKILDKRAPMFYDEVYFSEPAEHLAFTLGRLDPYRTQMAIEDVLGYGVFLQATKNTLNQYLGMEDMYYVVVPDLKEIEQKELLLEYDTTFVEVSRESGLRMPHLFSFAIGYDTPEDIPGVAEWLVDAAFGLNPS